MEDPIDNRQQHLDIMCFPVLFPTGRFGKFHPRQEKLSHCEYIKSRLLNKDSRFRKDAQYVFYLLWQKEMRELSAGVYNLLKTSRRQSMSVGKLLDSIGASDEHLEANLCTMLQSVHGTKQYWFLRQSELESMIREWGTRLVAMFRVSLTVTVFWQDPCIHIMCVLLCCVLFDKEEDIYWECKGPLCQFLLYDWRNFLCPTRRVPLNIAVIFCASAKA